MPRSLIVISDTDSEPDLIESWLHNAANIASATRSGLSDVFLDEILERRNQEAQCTPSS